MFSQRAPQEPTSSPVHERSESGQNFIRHLKASVNGQRASAFERRLLNAIQENPQSTIRECWETVEARGAMEGGRAAADWKYAWSN